MTSADRHFRVLCMHEEVIAGNLDPVREVAELDVVAADYEYLLNHIQEYDAYYAGLGVRFDRAVAERAKGRLRMIYSPSTGLDHLDLGALEEFGIEMGCIKTEFELLNEFTATAELSFALTLAVARRIPAGHNEAMRGNWARDQMRGHQLSGKTLGVLGVGRLGSMMVEYGRGFRLNVIGCDHGPRKRISELEYVEYDELLARSDIISIHIHLTPESEHFVDAAGMAKMKDGVIIVNTSRGKIVDEDALIEALESGKVGGYGTDVIHGEWRADLDQHPLIRYARDHSNVVITPHVGGVTWESQAQAQRFVAEKLAEVIKGWAQALGQSPGADC